MKLQNGHILISAELFKTVLEGEEQVNWVYYPERGHFLLAGKSKVFFEKMHKTKWMSLKDKNLKGDKSLYVREVLIDYELDESDRDLSFEIKTTGIITISLS